MIFGTPVRPKIYLSPGLVAGHPRWFRSQPFGCTGFSWEPPFGSCGHFHRGVDIARGPAGCDDDMLAMQAGTVFYAGTFNDGCKAVLIRHSGGFATAALHMRTIIVSKGQSVTRGQKIGTVDSTGHSTGCHDHAAAKGSFPTWGGVNDFMRDGIGTWINIWPRFAQNVTVRPKGLVNIRNTPGGVVYATTQSDGRIHRKSDGSDRGSATAMRKWDWTVAGPSVTQDGVTSNRWEKMWLDGAFRFLWMPLTVRSVA